MARSKNKQEHIFGLVSKELHMPFKGLVSNDYCKKLQVRCVFVQCNNIFFFILKKKIDDKAQGNNNKTIISES